MILEGSDSPGFQSKAFFNYVEECKKNRAKLDFNVIKLLKMEAKVLCFSIFSNLVSFFLLSHFIQEDV